jgi:hypothetical protein
MNPSITLLLLYACYCVLRCSVLIYVLLFRSCSHHTSGKAVVLFRTSNASEGLASNIHTSAKRTATIARYSPHRRLSKFKNTRMPVVTLDSLRKNQKQQEGSDDEDDGQGNEYYTGGTGQGGELVNFTGAPKVLRTYAHIRNRLRIGRPCAQPTRQRGSRSA